MINRVNFIQIISEVEGLLIKAGYSQDIIEQLEVDALTFAGRGCSAKEYIKALDRLIANELGAVVAELN